MAGTMTSCGNSRTAEVIHKKLPAGHAECLAMGWKTNYWDLLGKHLA
jgi:hypothetical protein